MTRFSSTASALRGARHFGLRRVLADRRGNVLMLVGFAIVPLTLSTGMAIDYTQATRLQTKLNAVADAAALAAVTEPMMRKTKDEAAVAALNMFSSQSSNLKGLSYTLSGPRVTTTSTNTTYDYGALKVVINQSQGGGLDRTAVVSYSAFSANSFAGVLGMSKIAIAGSSTTNAKIAPNIDFYVLLDASQSMLLPATSSGLASLKNATKSQVVNNGVQVGCAFACHQIWRGDASHPGNSEKDPKGGPNEIRNNPLDPTDPTKKRVLDNYQIARSLGIVLRSDLLVDAVQKLVDSAKVKGLENRATYRLGLSSFDYGFQKLWPTGSGTVESNLDTVKAHTSDYAIKPYYVNDWRTSTHRDGDLGSAHSAAFNKMTSLMPSAPGDGTNRSGDSPQAIMFLVTDGMRDEFRSGGSPEGPIDTTLCNTIKARGIRIAVLYTQYLPESANDNGWSVPRVRNPYLAPVDRVSDALNTCSSPGLFYKVSTDDDIASALNKLFLAAVATARLTQ